MTEEQPIAATTDGKRTRKKLRLTHSSSSSPTKDSELKDDDTSSSPPCVQAATLKVCPLSSMPPPPAAGGIRFGGTGEIPLLSEDDDRYGCFDTCFCAFFSVTFLRITVSWFSLCSEPADLASPPRACTASPNRVATPPASDTLLQPKAATTAPATSKEKAVVLPDAAASSSRPATWEERVSHPLCF